MTYFRCFLVYLGHVFIFANLPKSLLESIEAFNALNGGVSEQTRLKILPIIDNPNEEIKKMEDEQRKTREQADN